MARSGKNLSETTNKSFDGYFRGHKTQRFSLVMGLAAMITAVGAVGGLSACANAGGGDYQERPYYDYLEYNDAGNAVAPEPEMPGGSGARSRASPGAAPGPDDNPDPSVDAAKQSIPRD